VSLPQQYRGQPILVIGGGISFREALELVPADLPRCVISANEHGFKQDKFVVDYIAFSDAVHSRFRASTEKCFNRFDTPTISPHPWADYVIDGWENYGRDAGFVSIQAAVAMGGNPIIVGGVDCTRSRYNKSYFWQDGNVEDLYVTAGMRARAERLAKRHADRNIWRMPSMHIWRAWPKFDDVFPCA
jgi:hypothetical protein